MKDMINANSKESQNDLSYSGNLKFECSFSKKAIKDNVVTMSVFIVIAIVIGSYLCIVSGVWFGLIVLLLPIAIMAFNILYFRMLVENSYLEITNDNILKCKYKGRSEVCYPIKEIKSIKETTLKQAEEQFALFPVVLNSRGEEYYPEMGVLITFNRSWIKSVFPIYFNPKDVEGFIAAIRERADGFQMKRNNDLG